MGAGSFPAGTGPAGFDPVYVSPPTPARRYPAAIRFDPLSRTFPQVVDEATGLLEQDEVHPVDQKVSLLLGIEGSAMPYAASFFQKLRTVLNRIPDARKPAVATQEVRRVLAAMIAAGDVLLMSVVVSTPQRGEVQVFVNYENLRTGRVMPPLQLR